LPGLPAVVASDAQAIVGALSRDLDVAGPWVVNSAASLDAAVAALRADDIDLVVLVFQVWAEDFYLKPLVDALNGRPLMVWCYQPWRQPPRPAAFVDVLRGSGPVGTLEGLGTLRNLGVPFLFTAGAVDDPRALAELACAARAARALRDLRSARIGLFPYRNDQMHSTFVDEFRLRADLGPAVEYLSVGQLQAVAQALPQDEVDAYVAALKQQYPVRGVRDDTLREAARVSLGIARLAVDKRLDALAFNDIAQELHDVMGMRPCLYPPLFDQAGIAVGIEGDLGSTVAMHLMSRLTGAPAFYAEMWFWDEADNAMLMGHAGLENPALARPGSVTITRDYEYAQTDRWEGAHFQFVTRPGRVTVLQLRGTPTGWQAIAMAGQALDSEPRVEGYPHAVVRLDVPLADFLRRAAAVGTTQHWAVGYGDVMPEIRAMCQLARIPLESISA
jgi:L-arabinose isomerase